MTLEQTGAGFETTQWTLVGRLQHDDPAIRDAAMDLVIRRYWPALYAWLRRSGYGRDEAAEIVQHFFADVVLARSLLARSDQAEGRLRSLLLVALRRFLVDRHRRQGARGGSTLRPLDGFAAEDEIAMAVAASRGSADEVFERRWALACLEEALARCESHFLETNRRGHWRLFQARIISPARSGCEAPPLAQLAPECGFASAPDAAAAVQVVKRRVLMLLREVVAETTTSADDQEDEYQRLLALLV